MQNMGTDVVSVDCRKEEGKKASLRWLWTGLAVSVAAAIFFIACSHTFEAGVDSYSENTIEQEENIEWLYGNNLILYHDLYNMVQNTSLDYIDIYYPLTEEGKAVAEKIEKVEQEEESFDTAEEEEACEAYSEVRAIRENMESYYEQLESSFYNLNEKYDYMIKDTAAGRVITNTAYDSELEPQDYFFYLSFCYDENGNVTVGNTVKGEDSDMLRRLAVQEIRTYEENQIATEYQNLLRKWTTVCKPVNCVITYGISYDMWNRMQGGSVYTNDGIWVASYKAYMDAGFSQIYAMLAIGMFLLALFLPWIAQGEPWKEQKVCRIPLEGLAFLACFICAMENAVFERTLVFNNVKSGEWVGNYPYVLSWWIAFLVNLLLLTMLFFTGWYIGICVRGARAWGIWGLVKRRSLIYRFFPFIRSKCIAFYTMISNFDVTRDARKMILKIVLVNGVVLFIISSLWFGGFAVTVVYSVLLYFVLKKYVSDLQKKYSILLGATNAIAQGNLNVSITEELGVFEPFKPQIIRIQDGFRKAVEEEVKSQRMKAELITNVSHDLKTPLTAIITYIGLLQDESITEEQRREYLNTLERKSLRLKVLIEDLFEVSKANSKNVTLNIMDVDIMNLVKQVELEMSDKLSEAKLDVRLNLQDSKVILPLDSQKTYRIYENLFGNIVKYAMPGTRVYVEGTQVENTVLITLKNITANEINVSPDELTDRFVRGDSSRNTEGSGLGLAIAKSFTELQGGKLTLEIDGDLFKVTTAWRIPDKK